MNGIAATQASAKPLFRLAPIALLVAAATLLIGPVVSADARPVAKDGKIYACYKVKGKPRGAMRVLFKGKRCKRGERRVAWTAAGAGALSGQAGGNGSQGQSGSNGASGANGAPGSNEAALSAKISTLSLKVESLENLLDGVTNGDLSGVLSTLNGVSNADLTGAVDTVQGLTNSDLTGTVDKLTGLTNGDLTGTVDKLTGLTNGDLTGVVDKLTGITNADLLEAIGAGAVADLVCTQISSLTTRSNALVGLLDALDALNVLSIPGLLPAFSCEP